MPEAVKDERLQRLQALLNCQLADFNQRMVGMTLPVLFEKPGRYAGQLVGKSPYLQPVHAMAPDEMIGRVALVRIDGLSHFSLAGTVTDETAAAVPVPAADVFLREARA